MATPPAPYGSIDRRAARADLVDTLNAYPPYVEPFALQGENFGPLDPTGVVDSWQAVQNAVDAAAAAAGSSRGAKVVFPPGEYALSQPLDLSNTYKVTLEGVNGIFDAESTQANATLRGTFAGSTSANVIDARSSIGLNILGLGITTDRSDFLGTFVNADGLLGYDTQHFVMFGCQVGGTTAAQGGQYGVSLSQAISSQVERNLFTRTAYGVVGCRSAGYSNAIAIRNNEFVKLLTNGIRNPFSAWSIEGNTFESAVDGTCLGVTTDIYAVGPVSITNNWFGDNTASGKPWIRFAGSALYVGSNFCSPNASTDYAIVVGSDGTITNDNVLGGIAVVGNRFFADYAIKVVGNRAIFNLFTAANAYGGNSALLDASNLIASRTNLDFPTGSTMRNALPATTDKGLLVGTDPVNGAMMLGGMSANPGDAYAHIGPAIGWTGKPANSLVYATKNGTSAPHIFTDGNGTEWVRIVSGGKLLATGGLGVGNSAAGSTLGTLTKKIEVFDASGTSLGFVPVYGSIT